MATEKSMMILASADAPVKKYVCSHCDNTTLIASSDTPHCYHCSEELSEGSKVKKELTASIDFDNTQTVVCLSCDNSMSVVDAEQSADDIAMSAYCVVCGSESLEVLSSDEEEDDDSVENDKASEEVMDQEEESTQTALESSCNNPNDLQWSVVNNKDTEDGTLIASSEDGLPLIIFHKKDAPEGMQQLFASSGFVNAFTQVAESNGIGQAVKTFGGNFFNSKEIISSVDLEKMALTRMESTALPKLIACCQVAVEGGMKGIYTDIGQSIQDCLISELIASGIPNDRASTAVTNSFALHGSNLFGAIVAKACDLYNKPEAQLNEVKELIASAEGPTFTPFDQVQLDTQKILNQTTVALTPSTSLTASSDQPSIVQNNIKALQKELFGKNF